MARKTKSSLLAQGIELIESGVKKIREFNESIDPILLDSEKLKLIKPMIENLVKTLTPEPVKADQEKADQEKADQEKADQEKADQEKADQEKADQEPANQEKADQETPDPEAFDACLICVNKCQPDKRPEGVIVDNGLVKDCPAFTLKPEPDTPKTKHTRIKKMLKNGPTEQE